MRKIRNANENLEFIYYFTINRKFCFANKIEEKKKRSVQRSKTKIKIFAIIAPLIRTATIAVVLEHLVWLARMMFGHCEVRPATVVLCQIYMLVAANEPNFMWYRNRGPQQMGGCCCWQRASNEGNFQFASMACLASRKGVDNVPAQAASEWIWWMLGFQFLRRFLREPQCVVCNDDGRLLHVCAFVLSNTMAMDGLAGPASVITMRINY